MIGRDLLTMLESTSKRPIHGLQHWQTVERNGLYLAQFSGADTRVVRHFAYFHDCRRVDENEDLQHGPRAASLLKTIQAQLPLDEVQFQLLLRACSGHTFAENTDFPTLGTCWDADKLDLGRVGITPLSQYLFTAKAKEIADNENFEILRELV